VFVEECRKSTSWAVRPRRMREPLKAAGLEDDGYRNTEIALFTRCLSACHSLHLRFRQVQMTLQSSKRQKSTRKIARRSFLRLNRYMRPEELSPHRPNINHLRTCALTLGSPRSLRFFSFSCRLLKPSSLGSSSPTADDRPSNKGEMSTFHSL
jgi:hypothetical protein